MNETHAYQKQQGQGRLEDTSLRLSWQYEALFLNEASAYTTAGAIASFNRLTFN